MAKSIEERIGTLALEAVFNEVLEMDRAPHCSAESAKRCIQKISDESGQDAAWAIVTSLVQACFNSELCNAELTVISKRDEDFHLPVSEISVEPHADGSTQISLHIKDPAKTIGELAWMEISRSNT